MHDGKLDYQNDRSIFDITEGTTFYVVPSWNSFQVKVQIKTPRAVTDEENGWEQPSYFLFFGSSVLLPVIQKSDSTLHSEGDFISQNAARGEMTHTGVAMSEDAQLYPLSSLRDVNEAEYGWSRAQKNPLILSYICYLKCSNFLPFTFCALFMSHCRLI